jgi:hypothetical protein
MTFPEEFEIEVEEGISVHWIEKDCRKTGGEVEEELS